MKRFVLLNTMVLMVLISVCQTSNYSDLNDEELDSLTWEYYLGGKFNECLLVIEEVSRRAVEAGNDSLYATTLNDLGVINEELGNYQTAMSFLERARVLREKTLGKVHLAYAESLNNIAYLKESLGQYDEALLLQLEAMKIRKQLLGDMSSEYTSSLNNLAVLNMHLGNLSQSLLYHQEARAIREEIFEPDNPILSYTYNNTALLYEKMEKFEEALPLYFKDLEITEKNLGKEHPQYAISLNNLGSLYVKMGNYKEALKTYLQARNLTRKIHGDEHPDYAVSLGNLASVYKETAAYDKALIALKESKVIMEKAFGRSHPRFLKSINDLAAIYMDLKQYNDAWQALYQAMNTAANVEVANTFDHSWMDELLNIAYPSNQHLQLMVESLGTAYDLISIDPAFTDRKNSQVIITDLANALLVKARNDLSNEKDKLRILALSHDWLNRTLATLTPGIDNAKAFNAADLNKSVLLFEASKSEIAYQMGELPDSLVRRDRTLHNSRSQLQVELLSNITPEEEKKLIAELNGVNREIEELIRFIESNYPKYYKNKYAESNPHVEEIQGALAANTALLEYVITDSVVHIFSVDREQVNWHQFAVNEEDLRERIKVFHRSLSDYNSKSHQEYIAQAHWFYKNLVQPAISHGDINELVIVTDGELGHLPFEAFLVEPVVEAADLDFKELHYLIKDYNISYSYSASIWKEAIEATDPVNNGEILGVAADYELELDSAMVTVRMPTDQWRRDGLTALPAAQKEVATLQSKYAGYFAFEEEASERKIKALISDYSILHFATHGILDSERPVLSSLAFTEDNDSTESNFWQAHEISKSRLNADLVVLSACETGFGKFETGNGVASLARAFSYAGAQALVVSLWQVHDVATSRLMDHFYDQLNQGKRKDEALRYAKLAFLESAQGVYAHPSFWSPFIMMGKTDAVEIRRKNAWSTWAIPLIAFMLVGIAGLIWKRRRINSTS